MDYATHWVELCFQYKRNELSGPNEPEYDEV